MNWNDYEAAWKRQPLPKGASAEVADLRATFETKRRKLSASTRVRDWSEFSACLVVVTAYILFWRKAGAAGWPMGGAIALILFVAAFFVRERRRARRMRLGAGASLLDKVNADLAELRHQCHLVRDLWTWYLAPTAGALAIHFWVIVRRAPAWSPLHDPGIVAGFGLFFALILWFVWFINQRASRTRLESRIAELEKLRDNLLTSNDDDEASAPALGAR